MMLFLIEYTLEERHTQILKGYFKSLIYDVSHRKFLNNFRTLQFPRTKKKKHIRTLRACRL